MVSIKNYEITHTVRFKEGGEAINDILPIDNTHYMIAGFKGLLKATKDKLVKVYYKDQYVVTLHHLSGSYYLIG